MGVRDTTECLKIHIAQGLLVSFLQPKFLIENIQIGLISALNFIIHIIGR